MIEFTKKEEEREEEVKGSSGDKKWVAPERLRDDDKLLQSTLGHYFLNVDNIKKMISCKDLKRSYINVFYTREEYDPPLMENVLEYRGVLARFYPRLPQGWRYMCQLSTYVELLYERLKNVAEKGWGITWSEKVLDDMLEDSFLFTEVTIGVLNDIIFEGELMGNKLHLDEEEVEGNLYL